LSRAKMASAAAASDYFFASLPGAAAAALLTNALPFDRRHSTRGCLRACAQLLAPASRNSHRVLIVFPEGTRSADGSIGPFKRGVGELVAGTDLPVVPCHIDGAFDAWPKHRWLPRFRKVRVSIGNPRTYARSSRGKTSAIAIANDLRKAVISLENIMKNRVTGECCHDYRRSA
jgi:1-acyl-sn-glycerol-3-phosphate acyltransferase